MEMNSKIVFAGSSKSWTSKAAPLGDAHLQNVLQNRTIPCSSISVQCPWCQASSTYRFQQRWRWNSRLPPRDSGKKSSGFCTLQIGPFFFGGGDMATFWTQKSNKRSKVLESNSRKWHEDQQQLMSRKWVQSWGDVDIFGTNHEKSPKKTATE